MTKKPPSLFAVYLRDSDTDKLLFFRSESEDALRETLSDVEVVKVALVPDDILRRRT